MSAPETAITLAPAGECARRRTPRKGPDEVVPRVHEQEPGNESGSEGVSLHDDAFLFGERPAKEGKPTHRENGNRYRQVPRLQPTGVLIARTLLSAVGGLSNGRGGRLER